MISRITNQFLCDHSLNCFKIFTYLNIFLRAETDPTKLAKPKPVAFCSEIISDPISGCGGCRHGAACSACLPAAPLSHHRTTCNWRIAVVQANCSTLGLRLLVVVVQCWRTRTLWHACKESGFHFFSAHRSGTHAVLYSI